MKNKDLKTITMDIFLIVKLVLYSMDADIIKLKGRFPKAFQVFIGKICHEYAQMAIGGTTPSFNILNEIKQTYILPSSGEVL